MLCTNHCFDNTLTKNDGLAVVEGSLEAKWDPLGDRKGKYQKISIFGVASVTNDLHFGGQKAENGKY